jgi:DNA-binding NtrC family response regulator
MATILLIGQDDALLEGVAQLLAGAGHATRIARTTAEGLELAAAQPPLAVIVERRLALDEPDVLRAPLASGGVLLLYRAGDADWGTLPPPLQRLVLADLSLPLERHRLFALIQRVDQRARATGREQQGPAEHRAH